MSNRFIAEYIIDPNGTVLKLDTGILFKAVHKVSNYFVLVVEVLGNPMPEYEIEIVQRRKNTYIHQKAKFIDSVLVGTELFHFFAQPLGIESENEEEQKAKTPAQVRAPQSPPREEDIIRRKR